MCVLSLDRGDQLTRQLDEGRLQTRGLCLACISCVFVRVRLGASGRHKRAVLAAVRPERVVCRIRHAHKWGIASSIWSSGYSCIPELFESTTRVILKPLLVARLA